MADEKIFADEFVPNIQGSSYYPKWVKANPIEAGKWNTFRDKVLIYKHGDILASPSLATKYGKALIAAGKLHMSVIDIGAVIPGSPAQLTWSPPTLTNPTTRHISNAVSTSLSGSGDLIVICDEQIRNKQIQLTGWHHVQMIGGASTWDFNDGTEHRCIKFTGCTGTVHVEGWELTATNNGLLDALVVGNVGTVGNQIIQLQNIRIDYVHNAGSYHSDGMQLQNGCYLQGLRWDKVTMYGHHDNLSNQHGLFANQETGSDLIRGVDIRRTNVVGMQHCFWQGQSVIDMRFEDVWISNSQNGFGYNVWPQADGGPGGSTLPRRSVVSADGSYLTFADTNIEGRIEKGPRPGGDFVPAGVAGMSYTSPGYL